MEIPSFVARALVKAYDIWTMPALRFGFRNGHTYTELLPDRIPPEPIDRRIAMIDNARHNLLDALSAIDELKTSAELNKAELASALEHLGKAQLERASAEREVEAIRVVAQTDIVAFQKLANVPSRSQIARERLIGFGLGILASVVASGVWWLIARFWPLLRS